MTITIMGLLLLSNVVQIIADGWNWLRGAAAVLAAVALVLNVMEEVRRGKTPDDE